MKNHSILLVDDEEILRKTVSADLRDKGYDVAVAESGEGAIRLFSSRSRDQAFDLVITDLVMEGINGIEVLKKVKELNPEIMVIILTGHGDLPSAIEALRSRADDYILKPCELEEFNFRIIRCLEGLELRRRLKLYEELLPICCVCKKIRDDTGMERGAGEWMAIESYIQEKADIEFTHTYCPECFERAREGFKNWKRTTTKE